MEGSGPQPQLTESGRPLETINDVADSDVVERLVGGISDRTKLIVYMVGDTLLGFGAITPQVATIILSPDPFSKTSAISSLFATTGLYVLTMFGIYKSGKK